MSFLIREDNQIKMSFLIRKDVNTDQEGQARSAISKGHAERNNNARPSKGAVGYCRK